MADSTLHLFVSGVWASFSILWSLKAHNVFVRLSRGEGSCNTFTVLRVSPVTICQGLCVQCCFPTRQRVPAVSSTQKEPQANSGEHSFIPHQSLPNFNVNAKLCNEHTYQPKSAGGTGDLAKMTTAYSRVSVVQQQSDEKSAREQIADGIPQYAPACKQHLNLLAKLRQQHSVRPKGSTPTATMPSTQVLRQSITSQTALLPFCYGCACQALKCPPGEILPRTDTCNCATQIVRSTCWYCEAERLEGAKQAAVPNRSTSMLKNKVVINCGCGKFNLAKLKGFEGARKCAGCQGIVTQPFWNMKGDVVVFVPYTAVVRGWIMNNAQQPGGMSSSNVTPHTPAAAAWSRVRASLPQGMANVRLDNSEPPLLEDLQAEMARLRALNRQYESALGIQKAGAEHLSPSSVGYDRVDSLSPERITPYPTPPSFVPRPSRLTGAPERKHNEANSKGILDDSNKADLLKRAPTHPMPVFEIKEAVKLQTIGLDWNVGDIHSKASTTPKRRLEMLLERNVHRRISLSVTAVADILSCCGFNKADSVSVIEIVKVVYEGTIINHELEVVMDLALYEFEG